MRTPTATGLFIIDEQLFETVFGIKMRGVGKGYRFPFGGQIKEGESPEACTRREVDEETKGKIIVTESELVLVAVIDFFKGKTREGKERIPQIDEPDATVYFYKVKRTKATVGKIPSTDEMADPDWFANGSIPDLKPGDITFIEPILENKFVKGYVHFSDDEKEVYSSYIVECSPESLILE